MTIVEIKEQKNGSHRNQTGNIKNIPNGWAVIPDGMKLDNFPLGEVTAQKIDGIMTVTEWVAGNTPRPFPKTEIS